MRSLMSCSNPRASSVSPCNWSDRARPCTGRLVRRGAQRPPVGAFGLVGGLEGQVLCLVVGVRPALHRGGRALGGAPRGFLAREVVGAVLAAREANQKITRHTPSHHI